MTLARPFRFCRFSTPVCILLTACLQSVPNFSYPATSAFADDGQRIVNTSAELILDIKSRSAVAYSLQEVGIGDRLRAICRYKPGAFLVATEHEVYTLQQNWTTATRVLSFPNASQTSETPYIVDIAYDSKNDKVLLVSSEAPENVVPDNTAPEGRSLYFYDMGGDRLKRVRCRRVGLVKGLSVDQDGTLYFATRGQDLWTGTIDYDEDWPPLIALRYAAVATHEAYNGTPNQIGVCETAVAGSYVYCILRRMGGSGWGDVIRLKNDEVVQSRGDNPWRYDAAVLNSIDIVLDEFAFDLCASADGKTVYFTAGYANVRGGSYVIVNNGRPRKLEILK